MTAPAENSSSGESKSGGLAQLVRWLNEAQSVARDDVGAVGAPRRVARWTYGDPPKPREPDVDRDTLGEVRIGPAPRCAVAGETIALSVSLVSTSGGMYLGWPIKLEWSSSDPSIATVSDGGVVEVHAKGRVELTCRCEGKGGSVLLTVVEPAVAAAVGLPVPARLLAASRASQPFLPFLPGDDERAGAGTPPQSEVAPAGAVPAERPGPEQAIAIADGAAVPASEQELARQPDSFTLELPRVSATLYRTSLERAAVRRRVIASLAPSRATRRIVFRVAIGAATGGFVAVAMSQRPEDYFIVGTEPVEAMAAEQATTVSAALRPRPPVRPAGAPTRGAPRAAAPDSRDPAANTGRVVAEAGGSTAPARATPATETRSGATPPAAPATPTAPTISRVVVASSTSQLVEGESVRLAAAGLDDRGGTVDGRAVTWRSEDGDVAVVDGNGVVSARKPGTVTIVATSEGRTGRVTLTVGPRRAATPPAAATVAASTPAPVAAATPTASGPTPAPARESGAAAVAGVLRARADEFAEALRERNAERVAALYRAESPQDRKNLQALLERLRRAETRFKAGDVQLGATQIGEMEATADVQVPMSWTTPFGRVRTQTATFRAVLEPGDGGWRLVSIRAVGKID